jgi:hypothetical protein
MYLLSRAIQVGKSSAVDMRIEVFRNIHVPIDIADIANGMLYFLGHELL